MCNPECHHGLDIDYNGLKGNALANAKVTDSVSNLILILLHEKISDIFFTSIPFIFISQLQKQNYFDLELYTSTMSNNKVKNLYFIEQFG